MPTICDPDYPQCRIECPGTGYAQYIPLHGPCEAGCDPESYLSSTYALFKGRDDRFRFSGMARAIEGIVLSRLAVQIRDIAPPGTEKQRAWIEGLSKDPYRHQPFSFLWQNATLTEYLDVIVESTRYSNDRAA